MTETKKYLLAWAVFMVLLGGFNRFIDKDQTKYFLVRQAMAKEMVRKALKLPSQRPSGPSEMDVVAKAFYTSLMGEAGAKGWVVKAEPLIYTTSATFDNFDLEGERRRGVSDYDLWRLYRTGEWELKSFLHIRENVNGRDQLLLSGWIRIDNRGGWGFTAGSYYPEFEAPQVPLWPGSALLTRVLLISGVALMLLVIGSLFAPASSRL